MKKNNWYLCLIPLYLFTLLFILGPLVYMFVLSFATRNRDFGIVWGFSLENFIKMFDPIYVNSYIQSFKVSFWVYYGENVKKGTENTYAFDNDTLLDKLTYKNLWLDYNFTG